MAKKKYEEILKEIQEETKNMTYTPVEERSNVHTISSNSFLNDNFKANKNTNKTSLLDGWLEKGAFSDGYQIGDVTKTILGTASDIGTNLVKGVVKAGESIGDLAAYGGAQVVDWLGDKIYADEIRKHAAEDLTGKVFSGLDKIVDKKSILGEKSDNVVSSIGNMYAQSQVSGALFGDKANIGINIGGKKLKLPKTSLISGASSGMSDAVNKNAENWQVWASGVTGGLSEGISESLFGTFGLGGSDLDDALINGITKSMKDGLAKTLTKAGLKATGEGVEEVASYLLDYGSKHGIDYIKNTFNLKGTNLGEEFSKEELWENFFSGTLAAGLGGLPSTINTIKGKTSNFDLMKSANKQNETFINQNKNEQNNAVSQNINNEAKVSSLNTENNISNDIFSKQVDEVINGNFPKTDMLVVKEQTPQVLQELGLKNLPITMTQKHLDTVMNETGKYTNANYHNLGIDVVKQLPNALENPLNVIKSTTKDNSIVVVTNLSDKNDNIVIASIAIDGTGKINDIKIDSNVMTSAYGKNNYDLWMKKNKDNVIYDIDEGIIKRSDGKLQLQPITSLGTSTGIQYPRSTNSFSNDNLTQSNKNVKLPFTNNMLNNQKNNTKGLENSSFNLSKNNDLAPVREDIKQNKNENIPFIKDSSKTLKIKAKNIARELNSNKQELDISIDKKLRRWSETSTNSEVLKDFVSIKDLDLDKITYTPISNKKTLENAQKKVSTMSYEEGLSYVNAKMNDSKVDLTDLAVIDQLLVQAKQKGDYNNVAELLMNTTILGTELGQMVQQYSMIGKTTPEGQLMMYQKIVKRAKIIGDKSFDGVEITPQMVETVLKTYKEDGTYTQEDLDANIENFKQQIVDQMKTTTADKINGWRYLSMLGNPKTHIRNIVSNIAMLGTTKVKNAMARTLEDVLIKDSNNKTKTWKKASEDIKKFAQESAIELKDVIQGESKYGATTQLKMAKKIFKNKTLEKISNFNSNALSYEDWLFSKNAYIKNLQEYLTAKGITTNEQINNNKELVEQAKLYAIEQAEIATFRQYSKVANCINKIENTNAASKIAIGAMIPFKKTPINVAKTGVKYSPLGLIKNVTYDAVQLKNGNINASQFIDNLSQGLTGTSLSLLGYVLAKAGFITGDDDDDKEGKYDSQLGNQGYALKIGNHTYSLSWLSPTAMPFLIGANAYEELENKDGWDANILIDTLAKTIDPVSEMSFISGLTDALSSYNQGSMQMISNMAQNTVSNYTMQFFPTLLSQIAGTFDDKVRSTTVDRDSSFKFGNKLMKQAMYKIPGLRNQLPVATDIWGNEKEQTNNILERAYNNFLSPYSKKEVTTTSLDNELKRVYKETGETSVIPGVPQGYLKYKNVQYNMNSTEYTQFKKMYGTTANKYLTNLINDSTYKNANNDIKAKMIETIYKYSKALANEEFFSSRNINYTSNDLKTINNLKDMNMNSSQIAKYVAINSISSVIKNNKSLTTTEKHQKIAKEMLNSNLNDKQLAYLYGNYYSSEDKLNNMVDMKIPIKEFIKLDSESIESDYNSNGKTVSNSMKNKTIKYINSLNLSLSQKAILLKSKYKSINTYDNQIVSYVKKLDKSLNEKKVLLKSIGFSNYDKDVFKYISSQYSGEEKEKKLKSLGYKYRNGKWYS